MHVVTTSELVGKNFVAMTCQQKERKVLEAEFLFSVSACAHLQVLQTFRLMALSSFTPALCPPPLPPLLLSLPPCLAMNHNQTQKSVCHLQGKEREPKKRRKRRKRVRRREGDEMGTESRKERRAKQHGTEERMRGLCTWVKVSLG